MANDTCNRCGAALAADATLCGGCLEWLAERTALEESDVLEANRFRRPPLPGEGRLATVLFLTCGPLLLSLFMVSWALASGLRGTWFTRAGEDGVVAITLFFFAVVLGLAAGGVGFFVARNTPFRGAWWTFGLYLGSVGLLVAGQLAWPSYVDHIDSWEHFIFHEESVRLYSTVLHGIAGVFPAVGLLLAYLRRRQIGRARQELRRLR